MNTTDPVTKFLSALSAFLGCAGAGLTLTTLNPTYKAEEIARQLDNSGAKFIITIGTENCLNVLLNVEFTFSELDTGNLLI